MLLGYLDTLIAFVVVMAGVSLLITVLTQMTSAVFGLRGTHLRWGVKTLLETIDPSLKKHAESLSEEVLHHSVLSGSTVSRFRNRLTQRWRLASAISPAELSEIIKLLAESAGEQNGKGKKPNEAHAALHEALNKIDPDAEKKLDAVKRVISKIPPEVVSSVVTDELKQQFAELVQNAVSAEQKIFNNINQWFDSTMARVSQRFAFHMRIWTIVFSIVVAFALHLDAFNLFSRLTADPELRAGLVAGAETMIKQADSIIGSSRSQTPSAYVAAIDKLKGNHPDIQIGDAPAFTSWNDGGVWLRNQLSDNPQLDALIAEYNQLAAETSRTEIGKLREQAVELKQTLSDSGFQLIPDPYPGLKGLSPFDRHFWGVLASAALLSLGAPFWFNLLKSLSNLRPALAEKVEKK